jgi:hypothetical protein
MVNRSKKINHEKINTLTSENTSKKNKTQKTILNQLTLNQKIKKIYKNI